MNNAIVSPTPHHSKSTQPWKAIVAMSQNRAIGFRGALPWHLPEDLKWFKSLTTGNTIVMGRKTFESIGRPLPNRRTIVVSRNGQTFPGTETVTSLDLIPSVEGNLFIVGGGEIYAQALSRCQTLYVTRVHREVEGDAFFPEFESIFQVAEIIRETPEFSMLRYEQKG